MLTAVDAVLMVIDAAKGVEAQTRKLFEVCRRRGIPIFTFMNKCDRPTRNPIALLDELEAVLGIQASPVVWPLGNGPSFRGVFDRRSRQVHLFERVPGRRLPGARQGGLARGSRRARQASDDDHARELARAARDAGRRGPRLRPRRRARRQADAGLSSAARSTISGSSSSSTDSSRMRVPPQPRRSRRRPGLSREVPGRHPTSSPASSSRSRPTWTRRHRDRIAFLRVCSRKVRARHAVAPRPDRQDRAPVLLAQALRPGPRDRRRGVAGRRHRARRPRRLRDRRHADRGPRRSSSTRSPASPRRSSPTSRTPIPPTRRNSAPAWSSSCRRASCSPSPRARRRPGATLLAAVGPLQFEVVQYRLKSEYGAESRLEPAPWTILRWIEPHPALRNPSEPRRRHGVSFGGGQAGPARGAFPQRLDHALFHGKESRIEAAANLPLEQAAPARRSCPETVQSAMPLRPEPIPLFPCIPESPPASFSPSSSALAAAARPASRLGRRPAYKGAIVMDCRHRRGAFRGQRGRRSARRRA